MLKHEVMGVPGMSGAPLYRRARTSRTTAYEVFGIYVSDKKAVSVYAEHPLAAMVAPCTTDAAERGRHQGGARV